LKTTRGLGTQQTLSERPNKTSHLEASQMKCGVEWVGVTVDEYLTSKELGKNGCQKNPLRQNALKMALFQTSDAPNTGNWWSMPHGNATKQLVLSHSIVCAVVLVSGTILKIFDKSVGPKPSESGCLAKQRRSGSSDTRVPKTGFLKNTKS
jgi:hypothetical protein